MVPPGYRNRRCRLYWGTSPVRCFSVDYVKRAGSGTGVICCVRRHGLRDTPSLRANG